MTGGNTSKRNDEIRLILSSLHAQALRTEVAKGRGNWDNADIISLL
jgi:hypothetical protein